MKSLISVLSVFCILLSLCACGQAPQTTTPPATTTLPGETEPAPSVPASTPPATTQTTPPDDGSYLQEITNHDHPIFDSPSYDGVPVGTVQVAGIYTIVEEVSDSEGNLWGRLKSGAGWVDLTAVRAFNETKPLVSAGYIDRDLVNGEDFILYGEQDEHSVCIVFNVYDEVYNVRLYTILWDGEGYTEGEEMLWLEKMTPRKPLAAWLGFPGDLSMYAISVTDDQARVHTFVISQSGRNGMLCIDDITP